MGVKFSASVHFGAPMADRLADDRGSPSVCHLWGSLHLWYDVREPQKYPEPSPFAAATSGGLGA